MPDTLLSAQLLVSLSNMAQPSSCQDQVLLGRLVFGLVNTC